MNDPEQGALMIVPGLDFQIPAGALSRAGIPYEEKNPEDRYEGKLTWGITPSHRLMGSYLKVDEMETNLSTDTPADWGHIVPSRTMPLEAFSFNYTEPISVSPRISKLSSARAAGIMWHFSKVTTIGQTP